MGLDMYLYKVSKKSEFSKLSKDPDALEEDIWKSFTLGRDIEEIVVAIYWRKAYSNIIMSAFDNLTDNKSTQFNNPFLISKKDILLLKNIVGKALNIFYDYPQSSLSYELECNAEEEKFINSLGYTEVEYFPDNDNIYQIIPETWNYSIDTETLYDLEETDMELSKILKEVDFRKYDLYFYGSY